MTDPATVDLSMALTRFLALPEEQRQLLLAAGAHFQGNRVVTERLPVGEIAKLPAALREAQR